MTVTYSNFCGMVVGETRDGVEYEYIPDTMGSTIGIRDSDGNITDTWEYWPYGEVAHRTGSHPTELTFLGMIGYVQDALDRMFYVRARHLRADLARWLTVDPLWPDESAYGYVNGNPATWGDPSGTQAPGNPPPIYRPMPLPTGWVPGFPSLPSPPSPCDSVRSAVRETIHRTPCGNLPLPGGMRIPPTAGERKQWECLAERIRNRSGSSLCMSRMLPSMVALQIELGSLNGAGYHEADKYIHCKIGCMASILVSPCCAFYLAVWMEVKPGPGKLKGNTDPFDFGATMAGADCGRDLKPDVPWLTGVCQWIPGVGSGATSDANSRCSVCCGNKYQTGGLPFKEPLPKLWGPA